MDKEFSSAPLGSKERSADLMSAGQQMLQSSRNTQTAIPADSLVPTQPAPQLPPAPVDTRIVTNNQVAIPEQGAVTQQPQAEVKPPTLKESLTQQMQSMLSGGKNVNREEIRNELQIAEKQKKSQDIENQIIARQRSYNDQIERLQSNPDKLLNASKLNAQQNLLSREFSRELAELSFSQKLANDDYMGAERLMADRIADFKDQRQWEMQVFNTAFNFVQWESEEERKDAMEARRQVEREEDMEFDKEMALFNSQLRKNEIAYSNSFKTESGMSISDRKTLFDLAERGDIGAIEALGYDPSKLPAKQIEKQRSMEELSLATNEGLDAVNDILNKSTSLSGLITSTGGFLGKASRFASALLPTAKVSFNGGKLNVDSGGFAGQSDILADIKFISANLTLDKLGKLEVPLTPVSNADMIKVGEAATRLNGMLITKTEGESEEIVGIRGSEKKVREELETIQTSLQRVQDEINSTQGLSVEELMYIYSQ